MARRNYKLNEDELAQIEQAMRKAKQTEVRQRATAIHMLHTGRRPGQVAEMMAVGIATIYNWHKRWKAEGLEGLSNKPKSGRKRKATEAYCQLLDETLAKEPYEYGYDFNIWTVERLRLHLLQKTGIEISVNRFRELLKRQDYRYRRPKHDLTHLQDPKAKAIAHEALEILKKRPKEENLSFSLWTRQRQA
jgi:putative transposase